MGTLTLLKISVMELHYNYQMEIKDTNMGNNTNMGNAIKVALQYAGKRIKWHIKQMVFQLMGGSSINHIDTNHIDTNHSNNRSRMVENGNNKCNGLWIIKRGGEVSE